MKKYYLLSFIVFLILTNIGLAQTPYNKMLPKDTITWQHFDCFIPVVANGKHNNSSVYVNASSYAAIDTISINSIKYKKLYNLNNYGLLFT